MASEQIDCPCGCGRKMPRAYSFPWEGRAQDDELSALRGANADLVRERGEMRADIARVVEARNQIDGKWIALNERATEEELTELRNAARNLAAKYPANTKEVKP